MRVEGSYPTPIHGMSTLPKRTRSNGQAESQENMRADPVKKLIRRPSAEYQVTLTDDGNDSGKRIHTYYRGNSEHRLLVYGDGSVRGFVDGVEKTIVGNLASYLTGDVNSVVLKTVKDTTYVVDKTVQTSMLTTVPLDEIQKVSHLNIISALNYSETIRVNLYPSNGTNWFVVYTIPGVTTIDTSVQDESRATNNVAEELAVAIDTALVGSGMNAISKGSCIAVWNDDGEWVEIEVETGQGDRSSRVFNEVVEDIEGVPLYAVIGTRITVRPDPTSDKGTYYLEAVSVAGRNVELDPNNRELHEVVWAESRSPSDHHRINKVDMPHSIVYSEGDDQFLATTSVWDDRRVGSAETNLEPGFIGDRIVDIEYFQNRLVLVSEAGAHFSETDTLTNFWLDSTLQLLVSDRVSLQSSATGVADIEYAIPHDRDLLIIAKNAQFKISGDTAITPQTASMTLSTRNDVQAAARPTLLGNAVMIPINYGESSGLLEYVGQRASNKDQSNTITHHIVGLLEGKITQMTSSPNMGIIVVTTDETPGNVMFVYERFSVEENRSIQHAWSKWELPMNLEIADIRFDDDLLEVVVDEANLTYLLHINMYRNLDARSEIYLDNQTVLEVYDNGTFYIPPDNPFFNDYPSYVFIMGDGTNYPLTEVPLGELEILEFGVFKLPTEEANGSKVHIGIPYKSSYKPTRPYVRDRQGVAVTNDRLNIARFQLEVEDTAEVTMSVDYEWGDIPDQVYEVGFVGDSGNLLGEQGFHTGRVDFAYKHEADNAQPEFWTDGWLNLNISGINWRGSYKQSSRRMT